MNRLLVFVSVFLLCLSLLGCSSPEKRAQKLFDQGKYEEIIAQYPDVPLVKSARDTLDARERAKHTTDELMAYVDPWPDIRTPEERAAERLFRAGMYDSVFALYPKTPAANMARNAIADTLLRNGKISELIQKYPNTPAGWKARNEMANADWKRIDKLKGAERKAAIERFLLNSRNVGTEPVPKAQLELQQLNDNSERHP
jgi:hypothetical protein